MFNEETLICMHIIKANDTNEFNNENYCHMTRWQYPPLGNKGEDLTPSISDDWDQCPKPNVPNDNQEEKEEEPLIIIDDFADEDDIGWDESFLLLN